MSGTIYPHPPDDEAGEPARMTRLEEHVGYAERAVEELSEEVRVLNSKVRELTRRLAVMESRLNKAEGGPEEP